ncbi:MAG: hypothetical protein WC026_00210 [Hyphomicrobium sp.]|uniref:hypothetical protein n=1 Tax=Hyphomicrobium sp. TaxID=82 RepID=UPI0035694530
MRKYLCSIAAVGAAAFAMVATVPAADAGPRQYRGKHYSYNGNHGNYGRHHRRGRGYWRNGRWIALGIGAAIAAGAAGAYERDCYWRNGYRYCD